MGTQEKPLFSRHRAAAIIATQLARTWAHTHCRSRNTLSRWPGSTTCTRPEVPNSGSCAPESKQIEAHQEGRLSTSLETEGSLAVPHRKTCLVTRCTTAGHQHH